MRKSIIRNILVPVDFSKSSVKAIATAKDFGRRFGASLHLVHVHQWQHPAGFVSPMLPPTGVPVTFDADGREISKDDLWKLARKSGLPAGSVMHLREGASVFHEICSLARQIPADLIVMPTHGRTGLSRIFLGSVAERVVQHSPCPVFVARKAKPTRKTAPPFSINKILVPVDFSDCSRRALTYAIAFAERMGARLIVFHAADVGYAYTRDTLGMLDIPRLQDAAVKAAEKQMRQLMGATKFGGVKFETAVQIGPPLWKICEAAEERAVDLIITGTHGRTGFERVLMGSTAERVVRHAPCFVLVAPSHAKIRAANLGAGASRSRSRAKTKAAPTRG